MRVWTCNDHQGHYVGTAAVAVAETIERAEALMRAEFKKSGCVDRFDIELIEVPTGAEFCVVLQNGDY